MTHNRHSINTDNYYLGKKKKFAVSNGLKIILKFSLWIPVWDLFSLKMVVGQTFH